jgi:two-component system, NtrC family, sensor kinase
MGPALGRRSLQWRRLPMYRGLAPKLVVSLALLMALAKGVFSYYNVREEERHYIRNMVLGADQLSRSIASATWHAMQADSRDVAYEIIRNIATKQGIDRIRILNKEGRVTFSTGPDSGTTVDREDEACSMCHANAEPLVSVDVPARSRVTRAADGSRKLCIFTPLHNGPACSSAPCHAHPPDHKVLGVLDVDLDMRQVDQDLADIRKRTILLGVAQVLLFTLLVFVFTRKFVQTPIEKLIEGTKAVSELDLDRPIEIDSSTELQALAMSFNRMRERLKQALEDNAEFTNNLETRAEVRTQQLQVAELELIRSDRLSSLGQLAATVAHEINNPVGGMLNLGMLMQRILGQNGVPQDRIKEFRSYLDLMVTETSRVGRIVTDLLAFSRQAPSQQAPVDLNEIIRRSVTLMGHRLALTGARAELDLKDDLPRVHADGSQVQQVFINLLFNAAESMQQGGTVKVSTWAKPETATAVLEVSDTGSGITEENLTKVFDPFFTTKEEGKGVGLGLAVAYGIVQSHGGDIEVSSQLNEGTTFRVTLPTVAQQPAPDAAPEDGQASGGEG